MCGETTVKTDDPTITMINNNTRDLVCLGLPQAHYHEWAMWKRDLSEAEMNQIIQGGAREYRLKSNNGIYLGRNDLVHWWRFGLDASQIGKDYASAGASMDLGQDAVGIDSGDIVMSSPSE